MTNRPDVSASLKNLEAFVKVAEGLGYRATYAYDQGRVYFDDQRLYGMFDCWNAALRASAAPETQIVRPANLPEPHVIDGHYRDHIDKVNGYSEEQVRILLANAAGGEPEKSLKLTFDEESGHWYLRGDLVPGLNLLGKDLTALLEDLPRAWAYLSEHNASMPWPGAEPQPVAVQEVLRAAAKRLADLVEADATTGFIERRQPRGQQNVTPQMLAAAVNTVRVALSTAPAAPTEPNQTPADFATWLVGSHPHAFINQGNMAKFLAEYNAECLTAKQAAPKAEQDDAPPGWKKTAYGWAQSGESILAEEQANGTPGADAEDAARYRWLREQDDRSACFVVYGRNGQWGECGHCEIYGDLLDKAVDAARDAQGKDGGA